MPDEVRERSEDFQETAANTRLLCIKLPWAERMEVPPRQIGAFFDLLIETATTQTRKQGEFTIPGLGKLVKAQRAARIGRNPATGEAIKIKAKTAVKFRLSKSAKDALVPPKA